MCIRIRTHISLLTIVICLPFISCAKRDLTSLINEIKPAVVTIITFGSQERGTPPWEYWTIDTLSQGSGFFANANGDVITNYHVLRGADSAIVKTSNNNIYTINGVIAEDRQADLVMVTTDIPKDSVRYLKVKCKLPKEGETILVIGSPLGLEHTISNGIVSSIRYIEDFGKLIQITAPISSGSSGGPVINKQGEVIGVASFNIVGGQNLNFAIPGQNVKELKPYPLEEKVLSLWTADLLINENMPIEEMLGRGYDVLFFNPEAAYIYFKKALDTDPRNPDIYKAIADYFFQCKQYGNAIVHAKKAIRLAPYESYHYIYLARLQQHLNNNEDAKENIIKAIKLDADNCYHWEELASLHSKLGVHDKAIKAIKYGIKIDESDNLGLAKNISLYSTLARIYHTAGQYSKAIQTWKVLIDDLIRQETQYGHPFPEKINGLYVWNVYEFDSLGCRIANDFLFGFYKNMAVDYYYLNDTSQVNKILDFLKDHNIKEANELEELIKQID